MSRLKSHAKIVHSEINCVRVWNVHRNQRNRSARDLVADDGRHLLVHLKFDCQVDAVAHKFLRIPDGNLSVVMVVQHQQVDSGIRGSGLKAPGDGLGKRHLRRLAAEAKNQLAGIANGAVQAILRLRQVASMRQRFQDAVDRGLRNVCALINGFERYRPVIPLDHLQDVKGLREYRDQIQPLRRCLWHTSSWKNFQRTK